MNKDYKLLKHGQLIQVNDEFDVSGVGEWVAITECSWAVGATYSNSLKVIRRPIIDTEETK